MINDIKNLNELKYEKVDGILAIFTAIYTGMCIMLFWYIIFKLKWFDKFSNNFENKMFAKFIFYIPINIIQLLPIFIILKYRNQSLNSLGINKNKILKKIIIGIVLYVPIFLLNWKVLKILNLKVLTLESISIWNFLNILIEIAFVEEVIFRGYIQQRLRGLIKNRYVNLFIAAFLFGIIHVPFTLIQLNNVTFNHILASTIPRMIMHIYFVGVFKAGGNSILSSTITHTLSNFI